jgi:type II secretory pathway pseudopilin PulG
MLGRTTKPRRATRRGYSLLEVQVSFAILGIGLAGLCPLVVMQLRQVRLLELRLQGQVIETNPVSGQTHTMLPGNTYYIVPWQNPWTQKLAGSAQILRSTTNPCDPGPLSVSSNPPPSFPVTVIELDAAAYSQNLTAYVTVTAP